MADSELARQFKSLIVCDFCGYECNNEALYDEHLQSHIVGCCTTSSDFVKEESCNNDGDDISRRALSEVEDARLGVGLEDSASGSGTRFVAAVPVTLKSTSHLDINESKLVLPENRNTPYAYNCAVCGVGFKTADLYQRHVRTHVQKIDAALSRQGIYPEIVPVSIVPVGPGKLPEIITCKNSTIDIKVPTEVVKPKLLGGNNPVQKTYNDKLSDTVEALRLSLLKQSTPVAAESTTEVYEVSSQEEEEDFLQTAGEVSVSTTNSFERTLERSDGKRDGSTARKRKQELVSSARELIPSKTVVQDGNVLYCYNSDSNDSDATLKVESDVESQSADYQPSKEWTKVDNTASLSEDDSNSCGYYENNASIIDDKNTYKLLREHSYPILQATSSVNKAPQRPPGITQKNVIPVGNYKPNCKVAVYSPPSKTYLCNICGIKFSVYKNLERHLKAHRKQKRRKIDEHYATVCSKDENVVKDSPTTIAENFGININSKMLDTIRHNHSGRKETQIFNLPRKIASPVSSKSLHWVSNKVPQQQQQRAPSSVLNIKCFCGRKFSSVPSFRKHMQCHVHGPSRVNNQEDDVANDDCSQIKYNVEDTVESVYNVLRNDLGNPSLPSFVTEKAPRPKPAPEHKKVICPECGISFSSARYVKNHIGSKRCLSQVRHNWQVSQKNGNLNEPSYCSDCGVIVPNYAPKVLARHITNVPDKVKCRFCVLKLDRVRNAVSRKDLTDKVLESFPQNQKGSVPVNISSKGEGKESVKAEAAVFEKPSVHCLMKADAEEFLITDASGIVKTEAKNVPTGSSESQQDPTLIQLSNTVALASTLESKDVARVVQITPSTSSVNISAASVSGFGAETCKEYKCDRCGLVYLSQWSYSRHREKFCASKSNADSSVAQSANSSEQQQNITDSTTVVKSDSTCEVAEAANLIDSVVTRSDVSEEDDEEDSLLEYSVGYSFMGIDLGDTSDDETLSKENNSSDEKDNSDSDNDPDLYLCNFCSNRSTSPLSYKEHLQTHVAMIQASDDHTSFYCEKCASHTFNILHQCESVSETRTSTCGICLRQFQSIESAKMHALKCHDNTTLKFCIGCYWGFGSAEELKEHVTECADCVIRSSPRSSKHAVSHERILETDTLPSKSKSDKPDLSLSAEVPLPTPSGQFETTADKQEGTPSSQIAEVDKLHKPMSAPATVRVGLEPARISSSSNCFSNTVKVMVESSSVESHRIPEVASSLSTDLKHVISSFTNTWALKKPLSYADILGVKSDLPELATLPTLKCDLIDDHSKLRETKSQGCVETWEDKSRVLSTPSSQTSIKQLEFKEIPNKFTGFQELGTDDTLSLPCYSPEVISSPAKCADIQSEIEDIISKLPVLKSETAVDSEIGSVDVAEFCPNSAAVANSACSPLGVASMNTSTTQKNTLNEQAMASPVRTHSDSEDEGVCTPCSQSSAALASSPCSPKVVAVLKSIRQTTVPSSHACSPSEPRNRSTSPVLRKRKLSKIIPESSDEDISVTHYQGSVSHQQDISKSVQPLTLNQENSTNGIKLKLVRITSPQKEGIRLPSNFIAYKLVSGAPTIASTTASSNASGSVPSDVLSANVQGAAIDSTMRTKSLASIRVVSDTNSSTGMTGRRPLLEHLFSEIKPSNIGTISTEPDIPAPLAGSVSPLVATQHTPTSPPGNLPFVSKAKRKCTARKSTSRFAQSVKNGVAGQKSTVGTTCDWGILFTDKNGVRHKLPKCRVELFKLDDLPVQVSCLKSATLPVENKKVCTPEVLPAPKQVENRSLVSTSSPNTPQTPTLAISKILSSIKRFIKPSPLKEELVSNSAIATISPFSTMDSLPSSTKNLKCADISHERTCKSPVMPVSHVQNTIHVNTTSSLAGFPIESTSPAESASLYPVFRRRACRTYSRMSQPSPCRLTRSTSKTNLVNSSPQKLESLSADNFQKGNTPTRDGDINKILSAFKNLIDKHDSGSPSSTPQ